MTEGRKRFAPVAKQAVRETAMNGNCRVTGATSGTVTVHSGENTDITKQ
ncbi:hypothetical protein [Halorubrum sp. DTA98]